MPVKITTKISKARFTYSPFTPTEMKLIGDEIVRLNFDRWDSAMDANDSPAPPLAASYQRYKTGKPYFAKGIRNLSLSGRLRRSIKVLRTNQNRGTVGTTEGLHTTAKAVTRAGKVRNRSAVTFNDVLVINQRRSRMFALSPNDRRKWLEFVRNVGKNVAGVAKIA